MIRKWLNDWHTRNCPECRYRRLEEKAWRQCVTGMVISKEFAYYKRQSVFVFVDSMEFVPEHRTQELVEIIYARTGRSAQRLEDIREKLQYRLLAYLDACTIYREQVYDLPHTSLH